MRLSIVNSDLSAYERATDLAGAIWNDWISGVNKRIDGVQVDQDRMAEELVLVNLRLGSSISIQCRRHERGYARPAPAAV